MFNVIQPRFTVKLSEEKKEMLQRSISESEGINFRPVYCSYCGQFLFDAGEDMIGHMAVKCQKCKSVVPLNAAYFRRSKTLGRLKRQTSF